MTRPTITARRHESAEPLPVQKESRAAPMTRDAMQTALSAAAERLLAGKQKRTDGKLDKATLCREAGVVRTSAYRACPDIIAAFEQRVRDLAHDEALAHPLVRMQKRAEDAEEKAAKLNKELQEANARISVLANQINMAMRRVVKAEELRESDRESIEAERLRTAKEIAELQTALGSRGRTVTKTGSILALHRGEDA